MFFVYKLANLWQYPRMSKDKYKPEVLAPVGSWECLSAAIKAGADSVYFGIGEMNMRSHSAQNFSVQNLPGISKLCHEAGVKCYLALNVLIYDAEIDEMKHVIDAAKAAKIDAVIAFDLTAIRYANEIGQDVHISTQHSISNIEAIKFFADVTDRVVLARELTLEQIRHIRDEIVAQDVRGPKGEFMEIEDFVHGAMCVSVSGRCGMSLFCHNTSANRGKCFQPCRRCFEVRDPATGKTMVVDNNFVMSPEDLCTIGMLDEILDAGVQVLKIEGRGRPPEYVDTVVHCYKEAIQAINDGTYTEDKIKDWNQRLGAVFNRGLSEGFYRGQAWSHWSGVGGSKATETKEFVGPVTHYYPKLNVAEIDVQASELKQGTEVIFTGKTTGVHRQKAENLIVNEKPVEVSRQGDELTFKVSERVREGDKLYQVVKKTSQNERYPDVIKE